MSQYGAQIWSLHDSGTAYWNELGLKTILYVFVLLTKSDKGVVHFNIILEDMPNICWIGPSKKKKD